MIILILAAFWAAAAPLSAGHVKASKTILTNRHVIDCTGRETQKHMTVEITANTISGLRGGLYGKIGEKGVRVFDLKGGYVVVLQMELDISSFGVSGRII